MLKSIDRFKDKFEIYYNTYKTSTQPQLVSFCKTYSEILSAYDIVKNCNSKYLEQAFLDAMGQSTTDLEYLLLPFVKESAYVITYTERNLPNKLIDTIYYANSLFSLEQVKEKFIIDNYLSVSIKSVLKIRE